MCSRLALDKYGRLTCVVTTPSPGQPVGLRFRVIGNAARAGEVGLYFLQDAEAERRSMARRRQESLAAAPVDAR